MLNKLDKAINIIDDVKEKDAILNIFISEEQLPSIKENNKDIIIDEQLIDKFLYDKATLQEKKILYSGAPYELIICNCCNETVKMFKLCAFLNYLKKYLNEKGFIILKNCGELDIEFWKYHLDYNLSFINYCDAKGLMLEQTNNIYSEKFKMTTNDYDLNKNMNLVAILNIIQNAAGRHAIRLGVGGSELLEKGYVWMLLRLKFTVLKRLTDEVIIIRTWQSNVGRADYTRDIVFESLDGTPLLTATTKWVVVDYKTRRIIPTKNMGGDKTNYFLQNDDRFDKLAFSVEQFKSYTYHVATSMIDSNGHMNNSKYGEMIIDSMPLGVNIRGFEINYLHESMLNDCIDFHVQEDEDNYLFEAINNTNEKNISIRAKVKKWKD